MRFSGSLAHFKVGMALVPLLFCGCLNGLAERIVKAPNLRQWNWRQHAVRPDLLATMEDAKQLQITVGSPDAALHAWVSEPRPGGMVSYKIEIFGLHQKVHLKRLAATQPIAEPFEPRGTIIVLHGISDRQELDPYVLYKEMLRTGGYRVIQVDLRGHGRSSGRWISYGVFESKDMVQVLDELERQGLIAGQVGVLGFSYGGAVAIQWAGIDSRVKAIVAIEPYATFEEVAVDASWIVLGPLRWFVRDGWIRENLVRAGQLAGFEPADASALAAIQKTQAPVLLIHSRSDELTPFRHSQRLHDAAPDRTKLVAMENQSHFTMWATSLKPILAETTEWFRQHIVQNDAGEIK